MLQDERARLMTTQKHQQQFIQRAVFERRGATSYIGHLDLMRVFERAIRRAELPILYTQGYNPRPIMVFALPLGVGVNTEGDYVDVAMSVPVNSCEFTEKVNDMLPKGIKILKAVSLPEQKDSLMSLVTAADYRIIAKNIGDVAPDMLKFDSIMTTKKSKGKEISVDIRNLIYDVTGINEDEIMLKVAAGSSNNLRPDIFLRAVCEKMCYSVENSSNSDICRTALYKGEYPKIDLIL